MIETFIFRHEVVGLFEEKMSGGECPYPRLEKHGLLLVALVMLGGIMFFAEKKDKAMEARQDKENEKQQGVDIVDAWDTEKNDLLK